MSRMTLLAMEESAVMDRDILSNELLKKLGYELPEIKHLKF